MPATVWCHRQRKSLSVRHLIDLDPPSFDRRPALFLIHLRETVRQPSQLAAKEIIALFAVSSTTNPTIARRRG